MTMTKEQAEFFYGSIKAFYGIELVGSILSGIIVFIFKIYIYGDDNILEKVGYSCVCAATIFLLVTYDVTFDILKKRQRERD